MFPKPENIIAVISFLGFLPITFTDQAKERVKNSRIRS
jgi:hypothetical protein